MATGNDPGSEHPHPHHIETGAIRSRTARRWTWTLAVGGIVLLGVAVTLQLAGSPGGWVYALTAIGGSAFLYAGFLWFRLADRPSADDGRS